MRVVIFSSGNITDCDMDVSDLTRVKEIGEDCIKELASDPEQFADIIVRFKDEIASIGSTALIACNHGDLEAAITGCNALFAYGYKKGFGDAVKASDSQPVDPNPTPAD